MRRAAGPHSTERSTCLLIDDEPETGGEVDAEFSDDEIYCLFGPINNCWACCCLQRAGTGPRVARTANRDHEAKQPQPRPPSPSTRIRFEDSDGDSRLLG